MNLESPYSIRALERCSLRKQFASPCSLRFRATQTLALPLARSYNKIPILPQLNNLDILVRPSALLSRSDGRKPKTRLLLGGRRQVIGPVRDDEVEGNTDDEGEEVSFLYHEGDCVEETGKGSVVARVGEEIAEKGAPERSARAPRSCLAIRRGLTRTTRAGRPKRSRERDWRWR